MAELERQLLAAERHVARLDAAGTSTRVGSATDAQPEILEWRTVVLLLREELKTELHAVRPDRGYWPVGPTRWGG